MKQNLKKADIIIIGGGAAGLMAAYGACNAVLADAGKKDATESGGQGGKYVEKKVLILEKMPRPGRKIMITGKGRCNFTNVKEWKDFSEHIHPKPNFLKRAFYALPPQKLLEIFAEYGQKSIVERGDRAFPVSHKAMDVVDTLCYMARSAGAEILCDKEVCEIAAIAESRTAKGPEFIVRCCDGSSYTAQKVIVTTGGLSYPTTGSTGDGYRFAGEFGHEINECFPSLTAIVPKGYKIPGNGESPVRKENSEASGNDSGNRKGHIDRHTPMSDYGESLCGISLKNINISLITDGNTVQEEFGDVDFTDGGLEGPAGFKISRNAVRSIRNGGKTFISIDLKPAVAAETLEKRVAGLWEEIGTDRRSRGLGYRDRFRVLLGKLMPMQLIPAFMHDNPSADHKTIAARLKNWKMEVSGYVGYERCVITAGGVATGDIVSGTMESKLCQGLYFAGEVLDLDADTGGYNLQTAFSTGYLAGSSATASLTTPPAKA